MGFAVGFYKCLLLCWRRFFLFSVCWVFLSWNDVEFTKCFFHINRYKPVIISPLSINAIYHGDWYLLLKQPCIGRIDPTWPWRIILVIRCWLLFSSILFRIFESVFIRILVSSFLVEPLAFGFDDSVVFYILSVL